MTPVLKGSPKQKLKVSNLALSKFLGKLQFFLLLFVFGDRVYIVLAVLELTVKTRLPP